MSPAASSLDLTPFPFFCPHFFIICVSLPRIDAIGYNPPVDLNLLMERLVGIRPVIIE